MSRKMVIKVYAALFVIAPKPETTHQPKCQWINKLWCIYTKEYYWQYKKMTIHIWKDGWNLKMMPIKQSGWKRVHKWFHLYQIIENTNKSRMTQSRSVVTWRWGRGKGQGGHQVLRETLRGDGYVHFFLL